MNKNNIGLIRQTSVLIMFMNFWIEKYGKLKYNVYKFD